MWVCRLLTGSFRCALAPPVRTEEALQREWVCVCVCERERMSSESVARGLPERSSPVRCVTFRRALTPPVGTDALASGLGRAHLRARMGPGPKKVERNGPPQKRAGPSR